MARRKRQSADEVWEHIKAWLKNATREEHDRLADLVCTGESSRVWANGPQSRLFGAALQNIAIRSQSQKKLVRRKPENPERDEAIRDDYCKGLSWANLAKKYKVPLSSARSVIDSTEEVMLGKMKKFRADAKKRAAMSH